MEILEVIVEFIKMKMLFQLAGFLIPLCLFLFVSILLIFVGAYCVIANIFGFIIRKLSK